MIDETSSDKDRGKWIPHWRLRTWGVVVVLAGIVSGVLFDALFGRILSLRPDAIGEWLNGIGPWAPIAFVLVMATAVVISPIPSVPLDIAAGMAFGLFWGTVYVLIGAELGAVIAFFIARRLGRPRLARRVPLTVMSEIDILASRIGTRAILLMRLLPVFQFDWVSYAAGLTAIPFRSFALATLVGMIPPVIAIVAVGSMLSEYPVVAGAIFSALVVMVVIPLVVPWRPRPGQHSDGV